MNLEIHAIERPRVAARIAVRDVARCPEHAARPVPRVGDGGWRRAGHPDAQRVESRAFAREDLRRCAISDDAAARLEDDDAVDERQRVRDAVLDEHERPRAVLGEAREDRPHERRAFRIQIRRRFVQQQQARTKRDRPGDRESLLLAARERVGAVIVGVGERHRRERRVDARPDALRGDAAVLEAERDIVAGTCHDERCLGILEHDPRLVAGLRRRAARDAHLAFGFAAAALVEQSREREQERALARAGRAQQEDALALVDPEIDAA